MAPNTKEFVVVNEGSPLMEKGSTTSAVRLELYASAGRRHKNANNNDGSVIIRRRRMTVVVVGLAVLAALVGVHELLPLLSGKSNSSSHGVGDKTGRPVNIAFVGNSMFYFNGTYIRTCVLTTRCVETVGAESPSMTLSGVAQSGSFIHSLFTILSRVVETMSSYNRYWTQTFLASFKPWPATVSWPIKIRVYTAAVASPHSSWKAMPWTRSLAHPRPSWPNPRVA